MAFGREAFESTTLSAILFADVVGYSRLIEREHARGLQRVDDSLSHFRDLIADYGGRIENIAGDGVYALFDSATKAVRFAAHFQSDVRNAVVWDPNAEPIQYRIGINLGDTFRTHDGFSGHSVNVAARLEKLADPGGICISSTARQAIEDWSSLSLRPLGPQKLHNISEPIEAFAVEFGEAELELLQRSGAAGHAASSLKGEEISIAVLPPEYASSDPVDGHLCRGIADDIISGLCRFRELAVIARHSAIKFANRGLPIGEIGRHLGARYVLDGYLERLEKTLRVRLQLIDSSSGNVIWSEKYSAGLDEFLVVEDSVINNIITNIAVRLLSEETRRINQSKATDLQAYGLVLRGHELIHSFSKETTLHARRLFEQATDLDPSYARAYASISRTFNLAWRYAWVDAPGEALERAIQIASQSILFDDFDARGYAELGYAQLYKKRHDESLAAYERAIVLNPNDADLLAEMGDALAYMRQGERAVELLTRAIRLNPYHPDWYLWYLADAHFYRGDYRKTIEAISRMRDQSEGRRLLAASYALLGEIDEAKRQARLLFEKHPNFSLEHWKDVPPNKYPEDNEIFLEGARKAGLG